MLQLNTFSKLAARLWTYCRVSCLADIWKNIYHTFVVGEVVHITTNAYFHNWQHCVNWLFRMQDATLIKWLIISYMIMGLTRFSVVASVGFQLQWLFWYLCGTATALYTHKHIKTQEFNVKKKSVLVNILTTHITKTIYDSQCAVEEFWNGNQVTAQNFFCPQTSKHTSKGEKKDFHISILCVCF